MTTINVSWKWIEWAEWAASLCTANSPFPGHVYCSHPVQIGKADFSGFSFSSAPTAFNVPHSLALAEDKQLVCVADRQDSM